MEETKRVDRKTLKHYFRSGQTPKEEHFAALIDSMYNFVDDDKPEKVPEPVVQYVVPEDPTVQEGTVEADGAWHDLPVSEQWKEGISGCYLFHIVAGYRTKAGRYRMSEAKARVCQGWRRRLSSPQRCFLGFWTSPVRFRWMKYGSRMFLQVKARRKARGEDVLHYRLKEIWHYAAEND